MDNIRELFEKSCDEISLSLSEFQILQFLSYLEQIKEWNKKINITSIEKDDDIITKHFIDSLCGEKYINSVSNIKIADIGTGAGLPGIPMKILFPDMDIYLVDSSKKKIVAVNDMCSKLFKDKYYAVDDNIENLGRDIKHRESFDYVLTRAVAPMSVLLEYGIPLLKEKGKMIIYKGPTVDDEVENSTIALAKLNSVIVEKAYFCLPFTEIKRSIMVVEKVGKTDIKYPRSVGIPRKRPL